MWKGEDIWREQCFHQRPEGVQFNHFNTNQGAFETELAFKDDVRGTRGGPGESSGVRSYYSIAGGKNPGSRQRVDLKKKPHKC